MRQPAIFFAHGSPMNAIAETHYSKVWRAMGQSMPKPAGILVISAHWYGPHSAAVTARIDPPTMHDFGGFPPELHAFAYPVSGSPQLARDVQKLLAPQEVWLDEKRGLDHGVWSVLCHVFPQADVPVVQLSIDMREEAEFHFAMGRKLKPLRDQGILLMGSGNIVHNLAAYGWGQETPPFAWTLRFEEYVKRAIEAEDWQSLIRFDDCGENAKLSVPTVEHYLPLLYILAAHHEGEKITYPVEGVDGGSISMLSVQVGS